MQLRDTARDGFQWTILCRSFPGPHHTRRRQISDWRRLTPLGLPTLRRKLCMDPVCDRLVFHSGIQ